MHDLAEAQPWLAAPLLDVVPSGDALAGADVPATLSADDGIGFHPVVGITLTCAKRPAPTSPASAALSSLLARIGQGDERALRALHDASSVRLILAAMRIARRDDIAQEAVSCAFLQVWKHAAEFDERRASALTWLVAIVRHRTLDLMRRHQVVRRHECSAPAHEMDDATDEALQPCEALEQSQWGRRLRRAMKALTPMQRQVLSTTFLEGHSQEQAAIQLGIPLGTLKSHSRRGLEALRAHAALRRACA